MYLSRSSPHRPLDLVLRELGERLSSLVRGVVVFSVVVRGRGGDYGGRNGGLGRGGVVVVRRGDGGCGGGRGGGGMDEEVVGGGRCSVVE